MSTFRFSKYQGTGNDFILFDNRSEKISFSKSQISSLCNRKFGIGSDGLILLENSLDHDFEMLFYNPDGSTSFCGNGSRCIVAFAQEIGIIDHHATFLAIDGIRNADISDEIVRIQMADCNKPKKIDSGSFIDTGSPHFIIPSDNIQKLKIHEIGRSYRHRTDLFGEGGANINFIEEKDTGTIFARTFERGVEAETLSCGTGVTASAIVYGLEINMDFIKVETPGGHLEVGFKKDMNGHIYDVFLSGPAVKVFEGVVSI